MEPLYSIAQAAAALGVHRATVHRMVKAGEFHELVKVKSMTRIPEGAIKRYVARRTVKVKQ